LGGEKGNRNRGTGIIFMEKKKRTSALLARRKKEEIAEKNEPPSVERKLRIASEKKGTAAPQVSGREKI